MINGDTYPTLSLGEKFFLDLSSESDKSFYISYLLEKYNSDYINKYETSKITGIYLEVLKTTKDNYTAFIDDLNCQKNFFLPTGESIHFLNGNDPNVINLNTCDSKVSIVNLPPLKTIITFLRLTINVE